uniref:Uncharacterized protein n=1 Tax=Romanomermis culicivorax TaxID=13658 RepID=A0A915JED6_ROMCU
MDYSLRCNIFDRLISASISDNEEDNLIDYGKSTSASNGPTLEPKLEPPSAPNSPSEKSFLLGNVPIKMEIPICSEQSDPISMFDLPRTRRTRNSKSNNHVKNTPPEKLTSITRRSSRIKPRVESARENDEFSLVKLNHNDAVTATKTVSTIENLSLMTQNRTFTQKKLVRRNRKRVRLAQTGIKKSKRKKAVEQTIDKKSAGISPMNIQNENVVEKSEEPRKNDEKLSPKNVTHPPPLIVKKPAIKEKTVFTRRNLLPDIKNLSDVLNVWSAKMELQLACGFGMHENIPVDKVIFQAILRIKNLQNQKSKATETTVSLLKIQKELFTKLMISSGL